MLEEPQQRSTADASGGADSGEAVSGNALADIIAALERFVVDPSDLDGADAYLSDQKRGIAAARANLPDDQAAALEEAERLLAEKRQRVQEARHTTGTVADSVGEVADDVNRVVPLRLPDAPGREDAKAVALVAWNRDGDLTQPAPQYTEEEAREMLIEGIDASRYDINNLRSGDLETVRRAFSAIAAARRNPDPAVAELDVREAYDLIHQVLQSLGSLQPNFRMIEDLPEGGLRRAARIAQRVWNAITRHDDAQCFADEQVIHRMLGDDEPARLGARQIARLGQIFAAFIPFHALNDTSWHPAAALLMHEIEEILTHPAADAAQHAPAPGEATAMLPGPTLPPPLVLRMTPEAALRKFDAWMRERRGARGLWRRAAPKRPTRTQIAVFLASQGLADDELDAAVEHVCQERSEVVGREEIPDDDSPVARDLAPHLPDMMQQWRARLPELAERFEDQHRHNRGDPPSFNAIADHLELHVLREFIQRELLDSHLDVERAAELAFELRTCIQLWAVGETLADAPGDPLPVFADLHMPAYDFTGRNAELGRLQELYGELHALRAVRPQNPWTIRRCVRDLQDLLNSIPSTLDHHQIEHAAKEWMLLRLLQGENGLPDDDLILHYLRLSGWRPADASEDDHAVEQFRTVAQEIVQNPPDLPHGAGGHGGGHGHGGHDHHDHHHDHHHDDHGSGHGEEKVHGKTRPEAEALVEALEKRGKAADARTLRNYYRLPPKEIKDFNPTAIARDQRVVVKRKPKPSTPSPAPAVAEHHPSGEHADAADDHGHAKKEDKAKPDSHGAEHGKHDDHHGDTHTPGEKKAKPSKGDHESPFAASPATAPPPDHHDKAHSGH